MKEPVDWKTPEFGGLAPGKVDWARAAAYIDGEGSILINARNGNCGKRYTSWSATFYLKLTVANTDVRLPMWLKETFGGTVKDSNTEKYYEGKNYKKCWNWSTCANRSAWILYNCMPYFVIKSEQAVLGIQLQESMRKFVRGPGRRLPQVIVEERRQLKHKLLLLKSRGRALETAQAKRIEQSVAA